MRALVAQFLGIICIPDFAELVFYILYIKEFLAIHSAGEQVSIWVEKTGRGKRLTFQRTFMRVHILKVQF